MSLWRRGLQAVETGDWSEISQDIDFAIKFRFMDDYRSARGLAWDDARLTQLDCEYHNVRRDRGIFHMLDRRGRVGHEVTAEHVAAAMTEAPGTRASGRGHFIRLAEATGTQITVDWRNLKVNQWGAAGELKLDDPLDPSHDAVHRLVHRALARTPAGPARPVTTPAARPAPPRSSAR